jgi:hypothetical protein
MTFQGLFAMRFFIDYVRKELLVFVPAFFAFFFFMLNASLIFSSS